MSDNAPLAVVGIGCRFPGADGPDALWRVLTGGVDCIREVPPERWSSDAYFDPDPDAPGKMSTKFGGFIDDLEQFDPGFFGISDREVRDIDPQQRLLLEVAWHALEDAGCTRERLGGSRTGVFIGISHSDYAREVAGTHDATAHVATGTALSVAANRLSFWLDLRGPSIAVDTACSSSLVAIHLACQSIRSGECETAIAGGVNVMLLPELTVALSKAHMMAPDGRCKTLDASADGYVRGEGAGVIVIKPLDAALADGDRVLAVIRGSAVTQDGRSNGINAPNPAAQEDVVRRALAHAGVLPSQVQYVELHGTGTLLGDPIEAKALGRVLASPVAVGSIKTNIGHLEAAAGVAGAIKVILSLHHRVIPPSLHFRAPNPYIPFDALQLLVRTENGPYGDAPAIAGVSSFGFGGTNCHVIFEEAIAPPASQEHPRGDGYVLALSAHTAESLAALAADYDARLTADDAADVCAAASARRTRLRWRLTVTAPTVEELRETLREAVAAKRFTRVSAIDAAEVAPDAGAGSVQPSPRHVALPRYRFDHRPFPIHRNERVEAAAQAAVDAEGGVLARLRATVMSLLETNDVDDDAPFLEMGADSILLLDAVRRIENEFHVTIPLRAFFDELSTIRLLARHLESRAPAERLPQAAAAEAATASPKRGSIIWGERETRARTLTGRQQRHLDDLTARFTARTRGSKELAQRHRAALADSRGAAGFRFTTKEMLYPIAGARAKGARMWDVDGNEYVDLTMGFGVHLFGHEPEFITEALRRQLDEGVQLGPQARMAGETAELIRQLTGHERVAFCTTGTEAVMLALRIARTATGRARVAMFSGSYHGHSDAVLAEADGDGARPGIAGVMPGAVQDMLVLEYGSEDALRAIGARAGELAAVLVEPVPSRRPDLQPREFLHRLRELTARTGVILIFDELITGFRIAPGGAQEHFGVRADVCTYGKIIGGGMPIGVVAGSARCMDAIDGGTWQYGDASWPQAETTFFASTFAKHPLALAAARAALLELQRRGPALHEELNARTAQLEERLRSELEGTPLRVVRFGSLFRFAFSSNQDLFFHHLVEKGLYVWEGRNCFLSTAHTDADLDTIVDVVRRSVAELREGGFLPSAGEKVLPLSAAQRQLVTLAQVSEAGSVAYHIPLLLELSGDVDAERLRAAFARVVRRHDALRLQVGEEVQRVVPDPPFALAIESCGDDEVTARAAAAIRKPFDFARPLVPRATLYRTPSRTVLLLVFHHAAVDGLSVQLFLEEASRDEELPPAPLQFFDWLAWQETQLATEAWETQRAFWLEKLTPLPPPLDLAPATPRPALRSYAGGRVSRAVPLDAIRAKATASGWTPFMVSLEAYAELLHRISGADDFVIGVPVAGRGMPGSEAMAGYCTHLLPIRFDFSRPMNLRDELLAAFEHADYPFARLLGDVHVPLVRATFNLDRVSALPSLGGAAASMLPAPVSHAKFDLGLNVTISGGEAVAELDYDTDLFTADEAERLLERFTRLLSGEDLLLPQERERIAQWRRSAHALDLTPVHHRIARFDDDAIAVSCKGRTLTFAELHACANALAAQLPHDARIALVMPRSIELVIALLATLKADSVYVPIEPSTPPERLAMLLDLVDAAAVITPDGVTPRSSAARADGLAYVIFTSGSTGRPKPVAVSHRAIASYTSAIIERLRLPASAHYAMVSTFAADLGNTMLFPALCQGGTLHVIDEDDPEMFARAMQDVDCLKIVPSHFQALAAEAGLARVLPRTHLILGGDRAPASLLEALSATGTRVINHYGPTEATVGVMTGELRDGTFAFATALANASIRIADTHGRDVPPGAVGELLIGGDCLADGYLGLPDATAERFITLDGERVYRTGDRARMRPDGLIEILGRTDDQLKIRGHRVEPAEVAGVLARCPGVEAVHAGAIETAAETRVLVAWFSGDASERDVDAFARRHLPDAMVPSRCVRVDALPRNANGKIDRARLPLPDAHAETSTPRNAVEEALLTIWRDLLHRDVGIHDHFFELGGDSILSIQVAARARRAGLRVQPGDLYRHPSIARLAQVAAPAAALVHEPAEGDVPLTPVQRWFFDQEIPRHAHWNLSVVVDLEEWVTDEMLAAATGSLVAHHDALRLRFEQTDGVWRQWYGDAQPVTIERIGAEECDRIQRSLDLGRGELLKVALLDGERRRLLLVAHHLVTDGVSFRILLEDLHTALAQLHRGERIDLGPKTSSFGAWSRRLAQWTPEGETELWTVAAEVPVLPLPRRVAAPPPLVAHADTHTVALDEEHTAALLRSEPLALLLAALLQTTEQWTGDPALLVELESHGREELFDDVDLSRTVGWFTARYPLWLVRDQDEPLALIGSVREQLRSVPRHGIGYGILRHQRDDDTARVLRNAPAPEIGFNYLGQFDQLPLRVAPVPRGAERDPRSVRAHLLTVDAMVVERRLSLAWTFSTSHHDRATIERLASEHVAAAEALIARSSATRAPVATPHLDPDELERLLTRLQA